jgi:hypothetical protein
MNTQIRFAIIAVMTVLAVATLHHHSFLQRWLK